MSGERPQIYTVLLIFGILTGLQFTYTAEANKGLPFLDEAPVEYGFYMFDFGSSNCRFFTPEAGIPSNLTEFRERQTFSCAGVWEKYYLKHQISVINDSTNSSEIENVLQSSRRKLERGNISDSRAQLEKIRVRREYYLANTTFGR